MEGKTPWPKPQPAALTRSRKTILHDISVSNESYQWGLGFCLTPGPAPKRNAGQESARLGQREPVADTYGVWCVAVRRSPLAPRCHRAG